MKRFLFYLILFTLVLCSFAACGGDAEEIVTTAKEEVTTENGSTVTEKETSEDTTQKKTLLQFPAVSFEDRAVVYNGEAQSILVTDDLPSGTTVSYTYNDKKVNGVTDVGTYTVCATLENENYQIKQLSATLTITPAQFPAVTFEDARLEYDGKEHSIVVVGTLPKGTTVDYTYNGVSATSATEVGTYSIVATLKNPNYKTKTLTATLSIASKFTLSNALRELLSNYRTNLSDYLPETMLAGYEPNAIVATSVPSDYSDFVSVSTIPQGGFGEQWHMILDNIAQSERFYVGLNAVEGLTTASIAAFENYLDKNPEETAFHQFQQGIYSVTITNDKGNLYYVLDYTANYPVFGEQTVQVALTLDLATHEKTVRIQVGDANALKYHITENSYEFAIRYLGVRRAYFSVTRDENGKVTGHINEFLEALGKSVQSAADFYIEGNYVTAVGNKAGGMIGFTGTICELYNRQTGKLLGYEVEETLKNITYNTLWFGFDQLSGINSIRYRNKTDSESAAFFVNGSSNEWVAKKVGGISVKTLSRRFDIEFRTQYFYAFDSANNQYVEVAVDVPMFFVQEEQYDTLVKDVKDTNNVTISVTLSSANLNKLQSDYDTLLDDFSERKESVTTEQILDFIGTKKEFAE